MSRFAYLDGPTPIAFAHRGGDEFAPENTLRAFRAAADLGYGYLETDLHVTRDGRLVAFHDDVLDRVTTSTGAVAKRTSEELSRVRIAGTDPVPSFDELLEEFPDVRWNIDPKSDDAVIAVAEAVRRHRAAERVNIGAFSGRRLARLRDLLGPGTCTTAAPKEVAALVASARLGRRLRPSGTAQYGCLQVPVAYRGVTIVSEAFLDAAHCRGAQVHVWTIDDPAEMHRLLDLGVDGIMTDRPSVLRGVLEARGQWARGQRSRDQRSRDQRSRDERC